MLNLIVTVASTTAIVVSAAAAQAQSSTATKPGFEFLVPTGVVVPTGAQEHHVRRGPLTAVQLSYGVLRDVALTGTLGWARTRPIGLGARARLDVITYDAGMEYRMRRQRGDAPVAFSPFAGVGVNARSRNYRDVDIATTHTLAAYVGAGGEPRLGRMRLRLEVRNYLTGQSLSRSTARRGNDVAVLTGLRVAFR